MDEAISAARNPQSAVTIAFEDVWFAVAHRLSTVMSADEILVLHHGSIRERGTHRELVTRGGLYERLFRLQAGMAAEDREPARAV